ncbi:hypothetical protein F0562_002203 [Nyssa sinensis]|uniref:Uncharacterized protein n=1 Tax=Nyssa sinensis TaxID=561372 RepID=A0A5J5C5M2_9ASTE|nr:hypothetical protein F0562_002203 [Nyssa sinensis]
MRAGRRAPVVGGRWIPSSVGGAKRGRLGVGRRGTPPRGTGAESGAVSGISKDWEIILIRLLLLQMGFKNTNSISWLPMGVTRWATMFWTLENDAEDE